MNFLKKMTEALEKVNAQKDKINGMSALGHFWDSMDAENVSATAKAHKALADMSDKELARLSLTLDKLDTAVYALRGLRRRGKERKDGRSGLEG